MIYEEKCWLCGKNLSDEDISTAENFLCIECMEAIEDDHLGEYEQMEGLFDD